MRKLLSEFRLFVRLDFRGMVPGKSFNSVSVGIFIVSIPGTAGKGKVVVKSDLASSIKENVGMVEKSLADTQAGIPGIETGVPVEIESALLYRAALLF